MLNAAGALGDLTLPPGNRLERLKGPREGQHSIRINDQYRLCFVWRDGSAYDVEITDYHWGEVTEMAPRKQKTIAAHPGEILRTEFLEPMDISAYQLAKALHFPGIYEIVREERAISADVALRLGKYFGMTPQFWMNLQTDYDLRRAAATAPLGKIKPRSAA
jgi:antitoxin HigA-1